MDSERRIYNNDMKLLPALFPMLDSKQANFLPTIYVTLQKNRSIIENMVGGDEERQMADLIEAEYQKIQVAKMNRRQ
jgi:hypothetical protein